VGHEDSVLIYELNLYLDLFKELDSKISDLESFISKEYLGLDSHIHSIPGIGLISAAGIYY